MSIRKLPQDVVTQIKSSTVITSLSGVAIELFKNSLDAGSTEVDLTVDYPRGSCVVEDDGLGILPDEFSVNGGLGKMHYTSKWDSQVPVYGAYGIFLAALATMALVTITSHHHLHRSHNTLSLHRSEIVLRQTPSSPQHRLAVFKHGSRVTVHDLFGNMPVRVRQRAITTEKQNWTVKEYEELKHDIVQLLLSWPSDVTVKIRESSTNRAVTIRARSIHAQLDNTAIPRICNILSQASYIVPEEKASWILVGGSAGNLKLTGGISLKPCATKTLQFLSFGIEPVSRVDGHSVLHDEINRLFQNSAFGNLEDIDGLNDEERNRRAEDKRYKTDGYTGKELKAARKGVDRWPKFFIDIDLGWKRNSEISTAYVDKVLNGKGNDLSKILELLQVMIWGFLEKHQFRPKHTSYDLSKSDTKENAQSASTQITEKPSKKIKTQLSKIRPVVKSIPKRAHPRYDLLGTNAKLPSFRQPDLNANSPFITWSRIRSGHIASSRSGKYPAGSVLDDHSLIRRSLSAPPPIARHEPEPLTRTLTPDPINIVKRPLIQNCKIIRRPFDDIDDSEFSTCTTKKLTESNPDILAHDETNHEHFVAWVNPVTKQKSAINTRTGLASSNMLINGSHTQQPRFDSRQKIRRFMLGDIGEPGPWLSEILKTWDNPVFLPVEQNVPMVSFGGVDVSTQDIIHGRRHHCSQIDIERAFKESSHGINGRISKEYLRNAEVIAQVDKKFILLKMPVTKPRKSHENFAAHQEMLVILDQHAADERIRIEILLEELCSPPPDIDSSETFVKTQALDKHLVFNVSTKDSQLLTLYKQHFSNWGILYNTSTSPSQPGARLSAVHQSITVRSLPPGIIERCKIDSRLLIDLIRSEVWKVHERRGIPSPKRGTWLERIHDSPQGLVDMLNSRACRSAIMFNDELTMDQCQALVRRLADCKFPFQCAHGRPSLVPLVELDTFVSAREEVDKAGFGKMFLEWKKKLLI